MLPLDPAKCDAYWVGFVQSLALGDSRRRPSPMPSASAAKASSRMNSLPSCSPAGKGPRPACPWSTPPWTCRFPTFAAHEGEGDGSLRHWREAHTWYFSRVCELLGGTLEDSTPVLCQRFRLAWPLPAREASPELASSQLGPSAWRA